MKLPCQMYLNFGVLNLLSLCVLLVSMGAHRMRIFMWFSVVHCSWTCCYVMFLHMPCSHCHFLYGFPRALLQPWLLLKYSSQSAQARPATAVCTVSPYTLYHAGHPLTPAHEISSMNLHPSCLHPQPITKQKGEDFWHLLAWKVSLRKSMAPLILFYSLCE